MSDTENGGSSGSFGSAAYIWGSQVTNAETYTLHEKGADGSYTQLASNDTEIYFDLTALELSAGDHTFVVAAHGADYESSDYSNEVTYTVAEASDNILLTADGEVFTTADGEEIILQEES